jgi:hypothetical protein
VYVRVLGVCGPVWCWVLCSMRACERTMLVRACVCTCWVCGTTAEYQGLGNLAMPAYAGAWMFEQAALTSAAAPHM